MMSVSTWPGGFVALLVGSITALVYFLVKGYHARRQFSRLLKEGMPMPPWSPIFGHLLSFHSALKILPKDAQRTNIFGVLHKSFAKSDYAFYVDTWPFDIPFLVVNSASMANQATSQQLDLPKPYGLYEYLEPFAGGDNLFTMNGSEWKRSRTLFNPGFSTGYILDQVPQIVRETAVYVETLQEHARKGDMFSMDDTTLWFYNGHHWSCINRRNSRLNSQRSYNPLASAMRSQVNWHCSSEELNPFVRLNPFRPIMYWLNGRKMNNYISKELDKRFADLRTRGKTSTSRSIMDLVLKDYITEHPTAERIDEIFKKWAIIQIRLFLFAGHDSTSSTICYCYYLLSKNPEALEKIRAEHDQVFGTDLTKTENVLLENPSLINQLPYTLAVMKEALRLFPPAAGIRQGLPGVFLEDSNGNKYPTEGTGVLIMHPVIQRHPQYWKDPDSFIPERWLVGPGHPLYPMKGAWRPFEFGPRNCQGQALVILDVSVTLLMTVRKFDITPAYDEWDALHPTKGLKTVDGERAYQISSGAAHPADGFPCRVSLRT